MEKISILLCLIFFACVSTHYETPIEVTIVLPDCNDEKCLEELDKLDFSELIHIEVESESKKSTEIRPDITGGKLF